MVDCVGSGYCCFKAPCAVAMRVHGPNITECPELTYHDGRWWCGAVERAVGSLRDELVEGLSIGAGCTSPLFNEWREKPPTPEEMKEARRGFTFYRDRKVDWRQAFQHLSVAISKQMLSGDQIYLAARHLKEICGEEPAKEFLRWATESRSKFDKEFMG